MNKKHLLVGTGLFVGALLFSPHGIAESQADRANETRPYQGLDMMIEHIKALHGPTAAGPGMPMHKSEMKMHRTEHKGAMHEKMHKDPLEGLTAHQRKRLIFGSNN